MNVRPKRIRKCKSDGQCASAKMELNMKELIKEEDEDFILPDPWQFIDIKLEQGVETENPTMDGIEIGPVKLEPDVSSETCEMDSEDSIHKYMSRFQSAEEYSKKIFFMSFLEAYRDSPGIWDTKSEDYHDQQRREDLYQKLLTKYREYHPDADLRDMQKKINSYRSNYKRESKRLSYLETNSGTKLRSNLWYFDLMSYVCGSSTAIESGESGKMKSFEDKRRHYSKRHIDSLKQDPLKLEGNRANARARTRRYRERIMNNNTFIEEQKKKDRVRQKRYRDKKKSEAQKEETCEHNACEQALERELKNVENALPKDPQQRITILNVLYEKYVQPAK